MNRWLRTLPFVCLVLCVGLPFFGAEWISPLEVLRSDTTDARIFFDLRLPRLFSVFLLGAFLSVLGATYQILFRNPLAEPYVLGVSSAVALGLCCAEAFFALSLSLTLALTVGAAAGLLVAGLMTVLALSAEEGDVERIVLFGMGLNFFLSSLVFMILSYHQQQMGGGTLRWLFGQVPWTGYKDVLALLAIGIPLLFALWRLGPQLDALALGDLIAKTVGVSPVQTRVLILIVSCLLTSLCVAMVGSIGFVGLVVPNAVRRVYQPASTRGLFVLSFLFGGVFLSVADVLSRLVLPPFEFPIGIITTLFGGPLFLWILWRRK